MKNNYKILVLSDLKDTASSTLKSTVSLAKMIDGDIEFFHVTDPTQIVKRENQLSAIRDINEKFTATEAEIKNMLAPFSKEHGININYKFAFGNIKSEIEEHIKESQPNIIVLGKRQPKTLKFIGDSITQFVLNTYDGVVMIAAGKNSLEPDKELTLGILNGVTKTFNVDFAEDLLSHTQKPLNSFKIVKNSHVESKVANPNKNIVEYVFEQGDNAINNLSKYLSISKVNLLFVDRTDNSSKSSLLDSDIQKAMDILNVSILVGNGRPRFNHLS